MSCPSPDRVLDYVARQLASDERDAIDAHVDVCSECRALLGELARTTSDDVIELAPVSDPVKIGRYEIRARIGEGGMGTVYAAHDPQLDRGVAIKLVHPELAERDGLGRLAREGRMLAQLAHPNVVAIYDAATDGDRLYIAMELVDGSTLAAWLTAQPRTPTEVLAVIAQAGRGIAAAHRLGIVHRDIKPENVLVDRAGRAKVADFGLAETIGLRGSIAGTPAYMAPEQREGRELGPASDQYSLAAVLAGAIDPAPRWLARAIRRARATDPAARFPSIDAFVRAIDPVRRRRRVLGVLAIAALALAITAALVRPGDPIEATCARATAQDGLLVERFVAEARILGLDPASPTWRRVDTQIANRTDELAKLGAGLCEQRPQSAAARTAFELATACLAEHRAALAATAGGLAALTPATLPYAMTRVDRLEGPADCTNPISVAAEHAARATPAALAQRTMIRVLLAGAAEELDRGAYPAALRASRRAVELARAFGGVILAKTLIASTQTAFPGESFAELEAEMREAVAVAEAAHADPLRAHALTDLVVALARQPGREQEALALRPFVEAAIARSGRADLSPMFEQALGIAELQLGHVDQAIERFRAALADARSVLPADDPRLPDYIYPVGIALSYLRRDAEAATYHAEAYRVASRIWGASSPNAVVYEINLAMKHAALGDCATALREAAHARTVLGAALPPTSNELLEIAEILGTCHRVRHEWAAATAEHQRRLDALAAAHEDRSLAAAEAWVDLGDVEVDRGALEAGKAAYTRGLALTEALLGPADSRLALPLAQLAECELRLQHAERARALAERSLALFEAAASAPVRLADPQFVIARALGPRDRERARRLATVARDARLAAGPQFADAAAQATAWLAAH